MIRSDVKFVVDFLVLGCKPHATGFKLLEACGLRHVAI
jgi:hypothetical protein